MSSDVEGRRAARKRQRGKSPLPEEPAVRALALFLSKDEPVVREAFGSVDARKSVLRQAAGAERFCRPVRGNNATAHQGQMYGEGVRKVQTGLKTCGKPNISNFVHARAKNAGDDWRSDAHYALDVAQNFVKCSALEKYVAAP